MSSSNPNTLRAAIKITHVYIYLYFCYPATASTCYSHTINAIAILLDLHLNTAYIFTLVSHPLFGDFS